MFRVPLASCQTARLSLTRSMGTANTSAFPMKTAEDEEWRPQDTHYARLATASPQGRKHRRCARREISFGVDDWARHKSVWRHARHIITDMSSSTLQRLAFPSLAFVVTSASTVTAYNVFIADAAAGIAELSLPTLPFTASSLVLGLMATFRTNAAHDRFNTARGAWGEVINTSRDLLRQGSLWLPDDDSKRRLAGLIKAFPIALNFHLTTDGGHHLLRCRDPNIRSITRKELHAELLDRVWPEGPVPGSDFARFLEAHDAGQNVPLAVLRDLGDTVVNSSLDPRSVETVEMDRALQRLTTSLGRCERILKTPIPTSYTRHNSRFISVWLNTFPLALYPLMGPFGTIPVSFFIAYALLGIEDIGVQIEEPFNMLPLRAYSETIQAAGDMLIPPPK